MAMILIEITPVAKPRQTHADRRKSRPPVLRYRAYADELRLLTMKYQDDLFWTILEGAAVLFVIPMPQSWSAKKKVCMNGETHRQKPDLSNLKKAFEDALFKDDSSIHTMAGRKVWGHRGAIRVTQLDVETVFGER